MRKNEFQLVEQGIYMEMVCGTIKQDSGSAQLKNLVHDNQIWQYTHGIAIRQSLGQENYGICAKSGYIVSQNEQTKQGKEKLVHVKGYRKCEEGICLVVT